MPLYWEPSLHTPLSPTVPVLSQATAGSRDLRSRLVVATSRNVVAAVGLMVVLLSGCQTVGPNFGGVTAPNLGVTFDQAKLNDLGMVHEPSLGPSPVSLNSFDGSMLSWSSIGDGKLQRLIETAYQNNPSVEELSWRIYESRNVVRIVSGQKDPFADFTKSYERRKRSSSSQPFVASNGRPFNFYSVGVNSRWEIDLVGRIARETEAAVADYEAIQADYNDLRRVLAGDLARAYVQLRLNQELLKQNQINVRIQKESLEEVATRIEAGKVTKLDEVQLRSRIGLTESQTPTYRQGVQQSYHKIVLLIGQTPGDTLRWILEEQPQWMPPPMGPGVPADLLRRRADIRRSEREVASACARIGVAEAEFYPRLSLLGTLSFDSRSMSDLLDYDSLAFSIGPGVSWNILSLGRIEAQVEIQKAQLKQACARYRQTVLTAVSEVENALVAQDQQQQRIAQLVETVQAASEAVELAVEQYQADKASLERVVSNQRRLLRSSLRLAEARAEAATASVDLFQALGGGDLASLQPYGCEL